MSKTEDKLIDLPAERAVLAGLYKYGKDAYLDVADILQVDTFTDKANQAIYTILHNGFEEKEMTKLDEASFYSIAINLGYDWLYTDKGHTRYVNTIFNTGIDSSNIVKWSAKIRKLHIARLLISQMRDAAISLADIKGDETIEHILGLAENKIFDFSLLLQNHDNQPSLLSDGIQEYVQYLIDNPVEMIGISSGFTRYDLAIGGGFRRKSVSYIGARTNVGKGQFGINVGINVAYKQKIPVLYLDTEMSKEDHWNRTMSNLSNININDFETGRFSKNKYAKEKILKLVEEIKQEKYPYTYKDIAGKPFEEIIPIMRKWLYKEVGFDENGRTNNCLIIFDYMKLMSSEGISNNLAEHQLLGFQATGLHNFAFRYDVPVLTFIQLNRDGIDKETTAVASGSDRIVWLATNFGLFKPKSDEEIMEDGDDFGNRKMVILKSRYSGMKPGDYILMNLKGEYSKIEEICTKLELDKKKKEKQSNSTIIQDIDDIPLNLDTNSDEQQQIL